MYAARRGHRNLLGELIQRASLLDLFCARGYTALMLGVMYSEDVPEVVQALLAAGVKAGLQNQAGLHALAYAALLGHLKALGLLIGAGASLNLTDCWGPTAFTEAIKHNELQAAYLLFDARADVGLRDGRGYSAFAYLRIRVSPMASINVEQLLEKAKKRPTATGQYLSIGPERLCLPFPSGATLTKAVL